MKHLIDRDAVVDRIKRKISTLKEERRFEKLSAFPSLSNVNSLGSRIAMLEEILSFIDRLETKEVDD